MSYPSAAPLSEREEAQVAAVATASSLTTPVARAPFAGTVAAAYVPTADLTGANTNSRTINVLNRGQGGAGAVVVASRAFTAGVNAPANDETVITASGVAGATTVAEGDIIDWESLAVGTGLADPGGLAIITFTRA